MPGTATVCVGRIHQPLIRRQRRHGRPHAPRDATRPMQHQRYGRRPVRRTAGVADDPGVVRHDVVIDPTHHRAVAIVPGGHRDGDPSGSSVQMLLQRLEAPERAGARKHIIDPTRTPGACGRVALAEDLQGIVVHHQGRAVEAHVTRGHPMDAVRLDGIGKVLRISAIVHRHHSKVATHGGKPGDEASHTTAIMDRHLWYSQCSLLRSASQAWGGTLLRPCIMCVEHTNGLLTPYKERREMRGSRALTLPRRDARIAGMRGKSR